MTHPQRMRTFTYEISRLDDDLGAVYMRAGTGRLPGRCAGSRYVYVSIIFIVFRLYEGWTFLVI